MSGAQIDRLLAFLPVFEDPDLVESVEWKGGETTADGALVMPFPVYPEGIVRFFNLVQEPFWRDSNYTEKRAGEMVRDDRFISGADLDQIKTMLTWCARGERFCDGHWGNLIEEGRIVAILRRLKELREE